MTKPNAKTLQLQAVRFHETNTMGAYHLALVTTNQGLFRFWYSVGQGAISGDINETGADFAGAAIHSRQADGAWGQQMRHLMNATRFQDGGLVREAKVAWRATRNASKWWQTEMGQLSATAWARKGQAEAMHDLIRKLAEVNRHEPGALAAEAQQLLAAIAAKAAA